MNEDMKQAFKEYTLDHIATFNAIPVEFAYPATSDPDDDLVLDADKCWVLAQELGLIRLIKDDAD